MIEGLFFYCFSFIAIFASLMVITTRNPVHSVLWLIFTFFNASGLFLLVGAEFLAMILIVVYVGAVAVLFLFVIMMININLVNVREGFLKRLPLGIIVSGGLLINLIKIIHNHKNLTVVIPRSDYMIIDKNVTNTHALGKILYTDFILHFQIAGLILFVAMIGCIVLTLRKNKTSKKQDAKLQQERTKLNSITLVKIDNGGNSNGY